MKALNLVILALFSLNLQPALAQEGQVAPSGAAVQVPSTNDIETVECDLVIAESSLGGVAAALQAVKMGTKTCLTSMTDWIGGQMTVQGVSAIDGPWHTYGADAEFLSKYALPFGDQFIVAPRGYVSGGIYSKRPHTDEVERTMLPWMAQIKHRGDCWVSTHCFPPSEGVRVFRELLQPYVNQGLLKIFYESVPKRVHSVNGRISSVDFVRRMYTGIGPEPYSVRLSQEILDWYDENGSDRYFKKPLRLKGKLFIDGTETGELIVLSGARHRLGYEGGLDEAPEPECVMGFNFPLNLLEKIPSDDELAGLRSIVNPPGDPFDISQGGKYVFWPLGSEGPNSTVKVAKLSVFGYRKISDEPSVTMMNWADGGNDYEGRNFIVPFESLGDQLEDWKGGVRVEALDEAERRSLSFALWLNEQEMVRMGGTRGVTPIYDLQASHNFFGTGTGLSKFPYVRETRRLEGFGGFYIEPDEVTTAKFVLGRFDGLEYSHFEDSVGIGSYPLDTRKCPTGRHIKYPRKYSNHYQIPLRALISSNVRNLMVANKTLAVTQIANAAYRLHPTEWNAGYGAGTAAAVALRNGINAHQLMTIPGKVEEVQRAIVASGGRVMWFSDLIPSAAKAVLEEEEEAVVTPGGALPGVVAPAE